jgi:hypothetical protein
MKTYDHFFPGFLIFFSSACFSATIAGFLATYSNIPFTLAITSSLIPSILSFFIYSMMPFNTSVSHPYRALLILSVILPILIFFRIRSTTSANFWFEPSILRYYPINLDKSASVMVGFYWLNISIKAFYFYCFALSFSRSWALHWRCFFHYTEKLDLKSSNRIVNLSFLSFYFTFKFSLISIFLTIWPDLFYFAIKAPSLIELYIIFYFTFVIIGSEF